MEGFGDIYSYTPIKFKIMISVYQLKPRFQQLLTPALNRMHRAGITPNTITILAVVLSLMIGLAGWFAPQFHGLIWIVPAGLLLRMALNALDGMMARRFNMQSRLGEVLNELGDVVADMFVYLPLVIWLPRFAWMGWVFIIMAIINEFAGLLGKVVNNERRYDGPMGKSDRAFIIGLSGLLMGFWWNFVEWLPWVILTTIILMMVSSFVRIRKSL